MLFSIALSAACIAIDGDTLRCGRERVRLLAIDAPEMPGHCSEGRDCAPGDPFAAKRGLAAALRRGHVRISREGRDHYGRTLAHVWAGGLDLSCLQLAARQAIYVRKWDKGGMVRASCPQSL